MATTLQEGLLALRRSFPHLRGLTPEHFQPGYVAYEQGRRKAPNPNYEAELEAYEREIRREDRPPLKRPLQPPSKEITVYDPDGIYLWISWARAEEGPEAVRAATGFPVPGYESIRLTAYPGEYEAVSGGLRFRLQIQGNDVDRLREEVFHLLARPTTPEQEQGALIPCIECTILYPERYRTERCPHCDNRRERMEPARMADLDLSHELFRKEWERALAARAEASPQRRSVYLSALTSLLLYGRAYIRKEFGLEGGPAEAKFRALRDQLRDWIRELD